MNRQGMVSQRKVPTPPCMAASIFQDSGVTCGCEADVFGAMSLLRRDVQAFCQLYGIKVVHSPMFAKTA